MAAAQQSNLKRRVACFDDSEQTGAMHVPIVIGRLHGHFRESAYHHSNGEHWQSADECINLTSLSSAITTSAKAQGEVFQLRTSLHRASKAYGNKQKKSPNCNETNYNG